MTCTGASSEDSSVPLWPGATAAAMAGLRLMECKRTKLTGVIFVFTFFYGSKNEYINFGNKYETKYCRKQIQTEYGTDMDKKWMITGNKGFLKSYRKFKQFK
jgi:hypothetical protein